MAATSYARVLSADNERVQKTVELTLFLNVSFSGLRPFLWFDTS